MDSIFSSVQQFDFSNKLFKSKKNVEKQTWRFVKCCPRAQVQEGPKSSKIGAKLNEFIELKASYLIRNDIGIKSILWRFLFFSGEIDQQGKCSNSSEQSKPKFLNLELPFLSRIKLTISRSNSLNSRQQSLIFIMYQHPNHQISKNLMEQPNIFQENDNTHAEQSKSNMKNFMEESDPIGMFLNEDAFLNKNQHFKAMQTFRELSNTEVLQSHIDEPQMKETLHNGRKKSIFHNFQKHLITLIKKFIQITVNEEEKHQQRLLAVQLWNAFMKTRSFNKKILHVNSKVGEEFQRLSQQFSELKSIVAQNSINSILEAQRTIREEFVNQAETLCKETVQKDCNVSRFEQFYEYYLSFICELRSGPMTKRMTKNRKFNVVSKLGLKDNSQ